MKDEHHSDIVPRQETGFSLKAEKSVTLATEDDAVSFFQAARKRLLNVNQWKKLAGKLSADFQLTDANGTAIEEEVKEGFYFKIDIPAAGGEEEYDWVRVEKVNETSTTDGESIVIRVRPASNPQQQKEDVAHFYSAEATSNFVVMRKGKKVTAVIYDRNLKPNVYPEDVQAKLRGAVVGAAGIAIFSKLQWSRLAEALLKYAPGSGNAKSFWNKVVVITGATGGVGRATAWEFAKHGAKVALLAREPLQLEATKREVEALGGKALAIVTDVAYSDQVESAAVQVEQEWGPIDVWINNAMNSVFAPVDDITPEEFKRITEVTYLGAVYGTMAALKRMRTRDEGSIVLVGSALAYRGIPLQSAYCGAKHGVQGFYDSLRSELLHDGSNIKTCMVQLPALNTTQFGWILSKLPGKPRPMGKIYSPEVAARAIVFAAAHNRREILVGSTTYKAVVGNKIAPWYADHVLAKQGYEGQQCDEPADPNRKNNVWEPVHEDRGAYGDFGSVAVNRSLTLWASMNRNLLRAIAGAAVIAFAIVAANKSKD